MILPHPYSHVGTLPVQLSGKAESLYWFRDGVLDFVYSFPLTGRLPRHRGRSSGVAPRTQAARQSDHLLPDEQVYRKHCDATGQPYNTHHVHGDFSLDFVKRILDRIGQTEVLHKTPLTDIYSWELVCARNLMHRRRFQDEFEACTIQSELFPAAALPVSPERSDLPGQIPVRPLQ